MTLLQASGIRVRRGRDDVLHDVSLTVEAGEVVAILGPNGAGKSTLLDTLGGVLKPAAGRVDRGGRVATVMQAPGLARRSVQTNVELALAWWGVPRRGRRKRALDALTSMRADHLARRPATALSGGERRRVHLARAVAIRPDILLLDEPFAGLDPATHAALCDDSSSALRNPAGAVVMVVHDRAEAWAMADRLLVMFDGRIVADGRPHDVLERPPSPEVARFLGYDGELLVGDQMLLTRPSHVRVELDGDVTATVTRVVPVEDGARVELKTPSGLLTALLPSPDAAVGDTMRLRITGGVRFPRA